MTLEAYLQTLKNKKVAVLGLGISNRPLVRLLAHHGISVTGYDRNAVLSRDMAELEKLGARFHVGPNYLQQVEGDVIFRTPGLRPDVPELMRLRMEGTVVTSEMEAFFSVCPCKIIAVTGSDGKTTTTTLIAEMLKKEGKTVHIGGNIGHPLLSEADSMSAEDYAVLELSSFQLMDMTCRPDIAVVTNMAPNHLDVHHGMEEYIDAKKHIFLHQNPEDILVVNMDNEITDGFTGEAAGRVRKFSRCDRPEDGVYLQNGMLYRNGRKIMAAEDILLPGVHNIENYMAAICAVADLVSEESIRSVAATFTGVEHRIELVRDLRGVRYYNDSIASSPSRTIAGLRSFSQKVILIAGGYDKHIPYDVLGPEILAHVKKLVLTGATAPKIRDAVRSCDTYVEQILPIYEIADFSEAVRKASAIAEPGDVVILSPASASFDCFKNFEERGNAFKTIIRELR